MSNIRIDTYTVSRASASSSDGHSRVMRKKNLQFVIPAAFLLICGCATKIPAMSKHELMASAERHESRNETKKALEAYQTLMRRFPDCVFARKAYTRTLDLHLQTEDYRAADTWLLQLELDYGGDPGWDHIMLKWVLVIYKLQDYPRALAKCEQLILEYPESPFVDKALKLLPVIKAQIAETRNKTDL